MEIRVLRTAIRAQCLDVRLGFSPKMFTKQLDGADSSTHPPGRAEDLLQMFFILLTCQTNNLKQVQHMLNIFHSIPSLLWSVEYKCHLATLVWDTKFFVMQIHPYLIWFSCPKSLCFILHLDLCLTLSLYFGAPNLLMWIWMGLAYVGSKLGLAAVFRKHV